MKKQIEIKTISRIIEGNKNGENIAFIRSAALEILRPWIEPTDKEKTLFLFAVNQACFSDTPEKTTYIRQALEQIDNDRTKEKAANVRTVETKIFKFAGLSDQAKETALDNNRDWNVDGFDWWEDYDGLLGFSQKETAAIEETGHQAPEFEFDLGEFDTGRSWYIRFNDITVKEDGPFLHWLGFPSWLHGAVSYYFEPGPGRYGNTEIEFDFDPDEIIRNSETMNPEIYNKIYDIIEDKLNDIRENAKQAVSELMEGALISLRNQYEYLISDESVRESLECNEMEFYENGDNFF